MALGVSDSMKTDVQDLLRRDWKINPEFTITRTQFAHCHVSVMSWHASDLFKHSVEKSFLLFR